MVCGGGGAVDVEVVAGMDEQKRHGNGGGGCQGKECNEDRDELLLAQVEDTGTFHGVVPVNGQHEVADCAAGHGEELQRKW